MTAEPSSGAVAADDLMERLRTGPGDPLLAALDEPALGLNLAMAWPLLSGRRADYEALAESLRRLDPALYVYPFEFTHVTLVTFVNFKRHPRPSAAHGAAVEAFAGRLVATLGPLFRRGPLAAPFEVEVLPPVLAPTAVYLPLRDPAGAVTRIRHTVRERLDDLAAVDPAVAAFRDEWSIPGIVHSTIGRFRAAPADAARLVAGFRSVARAGGLGTVQVAEVLLTEETRPYMHGGALRHAFPLGEV